MPLLPPKPLFFSNQSVSAAVSPLVQRLFPPLLPTLHKGECGRIGVVGGSSTYTGAPFFAAITALHVGADMVHVFAPPEAAAVIKCYSPELMVHPSVERETLHNSLHRLDALVLGPGLGRADSSLAVVENVVRDARARNIPIVIDADGLFFIGRKLDIIRNYQNAILTPNFPEFGRLYEAAFDDQKASDEKLKSGRAAQELAAELGCTIFQKGENDIITNGVEVRVGDTQGSPRRCGGQGDLLSGTLAVFFHWAAKRNEPNPTLLAGEAASEFVRTAAQKCFQKVGRSMVAGDVIDEVRELVREVDKHAASQENP